MAITRRTSAAYSSFIAATSLHNNTLQDGQNSRGSLGWYENDENIINRSNQNPFCDYSRNGRRSTEISELPKIFVEALVNHQDGRVQNAVPGEDGEGGGQRAGGRHRHPHLPHGRPHDHLPLRQVRMVPRALQEQHGEP